MYMIMIMFEYMLFAMRRIKTQIMHESYVLNRSYKCVLNIVNKYVKTRKVS